jgi:hypothetical protein
VLTPVGCSAMKSLGKGEEDMKFRFRFFFFCIFAFLHFWRSPEGPGYRRGNGAWVYLSSIYLKSLLLSATARI